MSMDVKNIKITSQMISQIAELDEFKGAWTSLPQLQGEQLKTLKKISAFESIGSSNRIEGNRLSDTEVEKLLSRIKRTTSVDAFDAKGKEIGIVFETAVPFDTPRLMEALVDWTRKNLSGVPLKLPKRLI
jgi:Fic family protein